MHKNTQSRTYTSLTLMISCTIILS